MGALAIMATMKKVIYFLGALAFGGASGAWAQPVGKPLAACRVPGIDSQAMCGVVDRPLDEAKPDGKRIGVHFVVLPSVARNKLPDPVVLFAGGPGQSGIKLAATAQTLFSRLRNRRDVVVFDQRGVGKSMDLACPSDPRERLSTSFDMGQLSAQLLACKAKIKARHGLSEEQLTHFTTPVASRDMEAIRVALGAEQLNLVGGSYGTRAVMDYQRQFPDRVRRMVLDGVAPPDMVLPLSSEADAQLALDKTLQACSKAPKCNERYPNLAQALQTALERLPQSVDMQHPVTLQRERVMVSRELMLNGLRLPMYAPALASALPLVITQAAAGDYSLLLRLGNSMGGGPSDLAWGMHFSVICAEDFSRMDAAPPTQSALFKNSFSKLYKDVCAQWPQGPVAPDFYAIKASKSPVLVLSGGADPVTPEHHGDRVTQALGPMARHVVVAEAGHGIMGVGCTRDVLFQFVNAKTTDLAQAVNTQCLANIPRPLAFVLPAPIVSPPAASEVSK